MSCFPTLPRQKDPHKCSRYLEQMLTGHFIWFSGVNLQYSAQRAKTTAWLFIPSMGMATRGVARCGDPRVAGSAPWAATLFRPDKRRRFGTRDRTVPGASHLSLVGLTSPYPGQGLPVAVHLLHAGLAESQTRQRRRHSQQCRLGLVAIPTRGLA